MEQEAREIQEFFGSSRVPSITSSQERRGEKGTTWWRSKHFRPRSDMILTWISNLKNLVSSLLKCYTFRVSQLCSLAVDAEAAGMHHGERGLHSSLMTGMTLKPPGLHSPALRFKGDQEKKR